MLRAPLFKKVFFLGSLVGASLAHAGYEYRVPVQGITLGTRNTAPPVLSPLGDGSSKAGACAAGTATGCLAYFTFTPTATGYQTVLAAKGKSEGKWYWEATIDRLGSSYAIGVVGTAALGGVPNGGYVGWDSVAFRGFDGGLIRLTGLISGYGPDSGRIPLQGDTIGIALDMDAQAITFYKNCTAMTTALALPAGVPAQYPAYSGMPTVWQTTPETISFNYGTANFRCPVPSGYNAGFW